MEESEEKRDAAVEETVEAPATGTETEGGTAEAGGRGRRALAAAAIAAGLALVAAVGTGALGGLAPAPGASGSAAAGSAAAAGEEAAGTAGVSIVETADAMEEGTSPTIVHFKGTSGEAEGVDFYHATEAAQAMLGTDSVELAAGSYEVEFLPTVNPDGSVNEGTGGEVQDLEVDPAGDMERVVAVDSKTVPADEVTAEEIAGVQASVAEAVAKGDATLTGDAGAKVAEKVAENAAKAPAADKEGIEEAKAEATEAARGGSTAQTAAKTDASKGQQSTSSKTEAKADSGKGGSGSTVSSSSSKNDAKADSKTPSPSQKPDTGKVSHTHTWVAVTHEEPVYETRTRTVVDQAAYTTYDQVFDHYEASDGTIWYDYASLKQHRIESLENGVGISWKEVCRTEATEHPAVTHEESYQEQTGTKTVADGYKCSSCGATK